MANSVIEKSTIKKIKEPDFSQEITITTLRADKATVDELFKQMKLALGDKAKDEQIWQRIDAIILRDNVFNIAMSTLLQCYEIKIDPDELNLICERVKKSNPNIAAAGENALKSFASRIIEKKLIFDSIAKEWNIVATEDDAKAMVENYYKITNQSVREFLSNKDALEGIRQTILEQKVTDAICSKLKWKPDWEAIRKSAAEAAASMAPKPEEKK